jgi:hypothetical protein
VDSSLVGYDGDRDVRDREHSVAWKNEPEDKGDKRRIAWPRKPWSRWTGFQGKTLWDILQLLVVPLVLVFIGYAFSVQQDARQQDIEDQRAQDAALLAYLDQMNVLMLEHNLRKSDVDSEVRTLARARTLTVLEMLDSERKAQAMQFLEEAALVYTYSDTVPKLDLTGADLMDADLSGAVLTDASLQGADLIEADLSRADLSGAVLTDASLQGTDLSEANLRGAVLGTVMTIGRLEEEVQSLNGATMPNGQKCADWRKDR